MMNIRKWLEHFERRAGETVTEIVFGTVRPWDDELTDWPGLVPGVVLDIDDVPDAVLDREFDDNYGGTECAPFFAWSESFVVWIHEYDGSEGPMWAPRSPTAQWQPRHSGLY